ITCWLRTSERRRPRMRPSTHRCRHRPRTGPPWSVAVPAKFGKRPECCRPPRRRSGASCGKPVTPSAIAIVPTQSAELVRRYRVEPPGIGLGGKSSHTAPNIDRRAAKPGRREGAKAEKAVPFPGAVRRSKSFLASLVQPILRGSITREIREGRNRVVRSIQGRAGWVELSEASGSHPALRRAPDFLA